MSGSKKKGRSSTQSTNMLLPSTMPEKHLVKIPREPEFVVNSIIKSGSVFKCDVGGASFDGRPLTAIECSNYKEVEGYFKKREENDYSFVPISAYTHGDKILLFGEYVGEKFEKWVTNNSGILFTSKGKFTNVMVDLAKQFFKIVTTNHQEGVFIGNIQEEMYINEDFKLIIIPNLQTTDTEFKVGIKKDLADIKWFMSVLEPHTKNSLELVAAFELFSHLFPKNLRLQEDENKLKMVSYIICHNPIFWGFDERYLFSSIANKIYDKWDDDLDMFEKAMPIDKGLTNVGDWWNQIVALGTTDVLRKVYDYGVKQNIKTYSTKRSIIRFIRNTFEHFHQHDRYINFGHIDYMTTETFPNVHLKIYLAMASPDLDNGVSFYSHLREGKLNYCE